MKKLIIPIVVIAACGAAWFLIAQRNGAQEVQCTRVVRERLESVLSTNGRVEPVEWASARAERSALVERIFVQKGQLVAKGAPLVELDAKDAKAELAAANARISQARAEIEVLSKGGRTTDLADIDSNLAKARLEQQLAQKEYDTLVRLEAKKAATGLEVQAAKDRLDRARLQIQGLDQRRASLVMASDKAIAESRLKDAEAAAKLASERIAQSTVRAPVAGTVYQFDLKPGAYLNAGDLVASIGRLDQVRVNVFVDEPELGRVTVNQPVKITWDAKPSSKWKGVVEKMPTQIVANGTRQVGEVVCIIENPERELLPGTNINAEILTAVVDNALTLPKETIIHQGEDTVFAVVDGQLRVKKVKTGVTSTTKAAVSGLNEGEVIAFPADKPYREGMKVTPLFP